MKIWILGGIWPEITWYFYSKIIKELKISGYINSNKDYPQIIINSINAPELTSLDVTQEMIEPYVDWIKQLALHEPDFIVMACNTIHVYRDQLISESWYKDILSLSEIVSEYFQNITDDITILWTPITTTCWLYTFDNCNYDNPSIENLNKIWEVVNSYNATWDTKNNLKALENIIDIHKNNGTKYYVAACTEISELLRDYDDESITIIDTLELLISKVLQKIIKNKKR
jgi:aspartate/glutamate racemase